MFAQVIAEADGADLFNQIKESDGIAIHAILTDGQVFEFFVINFYDWKMLRGVGIPIEAIPWQNSYQICLPPSERSPDYLPTLKQIIEVIFDTFIMAYINGISAQKSYSERRAIVGSEKSPDQSFVPRALLSPPALIIPGTIAGPYPNMGSRSPRPMNRITIYSTTRP
jgi:hypothetical protein